MIYYGSNSNGNQQMFRKITNFTKHTRSQTGRRKMFDFFQLIVTKQGLILKKYVLLQGLLSMQSENILNYKSR